MKINIIIEALPEIDSIDDIVEDIVKAAAAVVEKYRQHVEYDIGYGHVDGGTNVHEVVIMGLKARPENM